MWRPACSVHACSSSITEHPPLVAMNLATKQQQARPLFGKRIKKKGWPVEGQPITRDGYCCISFDAPEGASFALLQSPASKALPYALLHMPAEPGTGFNCAVYWQRWPRWSMICASCAKVFWKASGAAVSLLANVTTILLSSSASRYTA